ncbi:MAG: polyprenyl synthetase family protein [Actinomycetota bacterium]
MNHSDWPAGTRTLDLSVDDLPHASSGTEWWYLNLHLRTTDGGQFSAFVAFFRTATLDEADRLVDSHTASWAIVDVARKRYLHESLADAATIDAARDVLSSDTVTDWRVRQALLAVMESGEVPLPDRRLLGEVSVAADRLDLRYGNSGRFHKDEDGNYQLTVIDVAGRHGLTVTLTPSKGPVRHGTDGIVRGTHEDDRDGMFYYCIPRCRLQGTILVDGDRKPLAGGSAWYDHEFGGEPRQRHRGLGTSEAAWDWAGVVLDNGWDVSLYSVFDVDVHTGVRTTRDAPAIAVGPNGERVQLEDARLEGSDEWTSVRTFNSYPTRWRLRTAFRDTDLVLTAVFPDQECRTLSAGRGFWEGRVDVIGVMGGHEVRGVGFVEVLPAQVVTDIERYLGRVGHETQGQVRRFYPDQVTGSTVGSLVGAALAALGGISTRKVQDFVVEPVRHIVDAGGKSWRGFLLLAAIELAGGDVERYRPLLGAIELIHSGSLIIDDIQDGSPLRRGVPTAHHRYGIAHAINAGTAAYFAFDRVLRDLAVSDVQRVKIYETYFRRHAGRPHRPGPRHRRTLGSPRRGRHRR